MSTTISALRSAALLLMTKIADAHKWDPKSMSLAVELRNGGPTVQPNNASSPMASYVRRRVELKFDSPTEDWSKIPSAWYDSLGSDHLDFQFNHTESDGKVSIPQGVYAFQHHVMPGNCRICVQRWVRVLNSEAKWDDALKLAGLRFRVAVAAWAGTHLLVVTTGSSSSGWSVEVNSAFTKRAYSGHGRNIDVMDVAVFITSGQGA